jgi:acetyl-CoA carboxylase carboxyl transferase subunit alpha
LWKDVSKADQAAASLRLTSEDLYKEGIIDEIVEEPSEGGHTNHDQAAELLDSALKETLFRLIDSSLEQRMADRYNKLQKFGKWGGLST